MTYKHSHKINIVEHTSKYLVLLVVPIIRALVFTNIGFYSWLRGTWLDILTVFVIIGLGFIAWYRYWYYMSDEGIHIKKGIIISKNRFIPYSKLSVVSIERSFYLIPFKAVKLRADTDGGLPRKPDFIITINKSELDEIRDKTTSPFINEGEIKRVYLPKNFYVAILSFAVSNTLTGVLFVATFVSGMGKVLGKEAEKLLMGKLTKIAEKLAFGIPPVAATIALTLLGGWAVSFVLNLIRHLKFSATRQSGSLYIKSGIVTRREYLLAVKRINLIELRQTFFTKLFGFYTTFVHCNGYGKSKDELSILMPAGERHELQQTIKLLLPEIPICKPTLRPLFKHLSRFLVPPIMWTLAVLALWIISYKMFPQIDVIILFIGIMAEIPCIWYLLVKILSYYHTGIGLSEEVYTFNYTYGYRIKTIAVPKRRIISIRVRRSLFQLTSDCCDLIILTYSEGRKRHVVPNLDYEKTKKIMGLK